MNAMFGVILQEVLTGLFIMKLAMERSGIKRWCPTFFDKLQCKGLYWIFISKIVNTMFLFSFSFFSSIFLNFQLIVYFLVSMFTIFLYIIVSQENGKKEKRKPMVKNSSLSAFKLLILWFSFGFFHFLANSWLPNGGI